MSNENYFIFNGNIFKNEEAIISPDNRAFKYGDGFFETMKMIDGNIIFADYHFERLFSSLQTLQFDAPPHFTKAFLRKEIQKLTIKNKHQSLSRIRLIVFRGDGNINSDDNNPNYIIQSWLLPAFPEYNEQGYSIEIYREARKSCDAFSGIKSNNYMPYAMASIWCRKNGFDDALIINSEGRLAEATTSNIFIVKDGVIKTPALSEGCIAGVIRRYLLQCFERENIACEQTRITEEYIFEADEIFLTNTGFFIQWVKQYGTRFFTNQTSKYLYRQFILSLLKPDRDDNH